MALLTRVMDDDAVSEQDAAADGTAESLVTEGSADRGKLTPAHEVESGATDSRAGEEHEAMGLAEEDGVGKEYEAGKFDEEDSIGETPTQKQLESILVAGLDEIDSETKELRIKVADSNRAFKKVIDAFCDMVGKMCMCQYSVPNHLRR